MERALELARTGDFRRRGGNPRVGCVVLDASGVPIADGHHRGAGEPHAEVVALAAAGSGARGGSAVVTLEPCNHTGRTGPCTEALIAAGISRVIFAQPDPNPLAADGAQRLRAAGVTVLSGWRAAEATKINFKWTFAQQHRRPFVRLKLASTLDGRVAARDGSSRWITSAPARADGHRLRAHCDAVLAGTGTILADDPRLTARPGKSVESPQQPGAVMEEATVGGEIEQPIRAVFGTSALPPDAMIFDDAAETVLLRTRSPKQALAELRGLGVSSVLIEGGPGAAAAFLEAGLVDEVINYVAPVILGSGPAAVGDLGIDTIADALRGRITDVRSVGDGTDLCVRITTRLATADTKIDHEIEE
ncbi:bifunctional diaminohydroxyphosphoribosylaminopyrimidine deaminase/5-amino-6-(5-phosphoribosylamino)uracil reductase RibD [Microlunatus elymi]|uniref:Riboflavin biosynthesis protein RibD n=2 Tax=Microlunatus elymi TaxID=2596828 RepID=A0A516Q5J6_9ACTN|nr:bifunctional diaminohydroxyphosphoribosylaminopyrimidine deaminase/5-amino-6-(5-phosphoribosylamino)uracil reductase RibD [Microlunatus elymi]